MGATRDGLRAAARPLALKLGRRPAGIWLAWLALAYSALASKGRLLALVGDPIGRASTHSDAIVCWTALVAAAVALWMRRAIAQVFGGIVLANLLIYAINQGDWFGFAVGVLGFAGLLVNRRWFDTSLPNVEK